LNKQATKEVKKIRAGFPRGDGLHPRASGGGGSWLGGSLWIYEKKGGGKTAGKLNLVHSLLKSAKLAKKKTRRRRGRERALVVLP